MTQLNKWLVPAILGGVAWVGLAASEAQAQIGLSPNARLNLVGQLPGMPGTGMLVGPGGISPFPAYGNLAQSAYNPYSGYGGYGYGMNYDPYGGYLRGAADVYRGQADFIKAREQAKLMHEQVRQERLKTRKMMFDQWLDMKRRMPTSEQIRQQLVQQEILRSLNGPQTTEVASGAPLNYLLGPIQEMINRGAGKPVVLDRDQVRRLNVTKGDGFGNIGLLRNEGKLTIPVALTTMAPADQTRAMLRDLETFTRMAYEQASAGGPVDGNVIKQLEDLSGQLSAQLTRNINDINFADYSEGRRFLRSLNNAIALLRQPDASRWVSGQFAAQGATVQDLVQYMTSKGLRFAPANSGDEPAYNAVHQAMVGLYNSLKTTQVATTAPPASSPEK